MPEIESANSPTPPISQSSTSSWLRGRRLALLMTLVILLLVASYDPSTQRLWRQIAGQQVDRIAWGTNYDAALAESKATGKPVLLDFHASWCQPCQLMEREVWSDPRVDRIVADHFIPVSLDVDVTANAAPATRYRVDAIPRVLVVADDGSVIRDGDSLPPDSASAMLAFLAAQSASPK